MEFFVKEIIKFYEKTNLRFYIKRFILNKLFERFLAL